MIFILIVPILCKILLILIQFIGFADKGGDPEVIRESQRRRFADVSLVDKVLELDSKWREGAYT